ncbi:MAG: Glutathione transport system permease protein GsiD [Dehalococcoidia bacterium]|nr:Glutathione transport system permease protein GsiD [Chloroflexota bacterium]
MSTFRSTIKHLTRYRSATVGLVIIGAMVVVAIYALILWSPGEAISLWRGDGGIWHETPRIAWPRWINLLPGVNRPETIIMDSREAGTTKSVSPLGEGLSTVEILLPFDFEYDDFPKEITLFFAVEYDKLAPSVSLIWLTPDGREISLGSRAAGPPYRISLDTALMRRLGGEAAERALFQDPAGELLRGRYALRVEGWLFEEGADLDARLVVYGQVHGLAGTDHLRRDIMVALIWGTPIALVFGLLAAVGATASTLVIAAIGVWFGKWVDGVFRWLTQVNIILPILPILIMIGYLYSRSIWVMLGMVIALNVFSASFFVFRSMFLPLKESPYIEAARAYGAGNWRIIFRYMLPKVAPVLLPLFVIQIPGFVFLEATLAVLGLGDPLLPTWGKVLSDAWANGAVYMGHYYWTVLPALVLMLLGLGFALVGFTLDRIVNPRLREV